MVAFPSGHLSLHDFFLPQANGNNPPALLVSPHLLLNLVMLLFCRFWTMSLKVLREGRAERCIFCVVSRSVQHCSCYISFQVNDARQREAMEAQIHHFGQTPSQVLKEPHPVRLPPEVRHSFYRLQRDVVMLMSAPAFSILGDFPKFYVGEAHAHPLLPTFHSFHRSASCRFLVQRLLWQT